MASDSYKTLYGPANLPSAAGAIAGPTGGKQWIISRITVVNTDIVSRTFALYVGGTAAVNQITPATVTLAAGYMCEIDELDSLDSGESIYGVASVASKLTIRISGDEFTP